MATSSTSSATTKTNILTTLGAGSGIDTKALAESLVEAERAPKKERIDAKIAKTEARISGYGTLRFALSELKSAFATLNDARDFQSLQVVNSQPSAVSVTAGSAAMAGSLNLQVTQLAAARQVTTGGFASRTTPLNGGSAFELSLSVNGGTAKTIAVATDTPEGMANAINAAGLGLSAQVVNTGSSVQVVVTGQQGAANTYTLSARTTGGAAIAGLDFGTQLQAAADAKFSLNGIDIVRSNNTVTDVLDGVTLELNTLTTGAARIDLRRDASALKKNFQALVTAYNVFEEAAKAMGSRTKSDDEDDTITGSLSGDSLLQSIRSQVRSYVTGNSSSPGTTVLAARNVGLTLDRDGKMVLDEKRFDTAVAGNFSEVVKVFTGNANDQSLYSPAPGGVAGDAFKGIDQMIRATGTIAAQTESANEQLKKYKEDLAKLETRMTAVMERYTRQFTAMDSLVGEATATRNRLKSTFDAWTKSS